MPPTAGHDGAPVDRHPGGLPVVLFSPGSGGYRAQDTALVQDLASHGYLVATIDHTDDDGAVDFPDGRIAQRVRPSDETTPQRTQDVLERAKDTRFVLDELTALDHGQNPDVDHHRLPQGLRGALDLNRVAMFGHSMGGATTVEAMHEDPRIQAGINLDGAVYGPVVTAGLNRPYLTMDDELKHGELDPTRRELWNNSTGWKREFRLLGSSHLTFSDLEFMLSRAASVVTLGPGVVPAVIGTIDPARAFTVQSTYIDAFFDLHLRHHAEPLLDGPSPQFPEMEFRP
jgi:predicted dienelactone hydrolase